MFYHKKKGEHIPPIDVFPAATHKLNLKKLMGCDYFPGHKELFGCFNKDNERSCNAVSYITAAYMVNTTSNGIIPTSVSTVPNNFGQMVAQYVVKARPTYEQMMYITSSMGRQGYDNAITTKAWDIVEIAAKKGVISYDGIVVPATPASLISML